MTVAVVIEDKYTIGQCGGDDAFSYCVFRNGRPFVTDCTLAEAMRKRIALENKQAKGGEGK